MSFYLAFDDDYARIRIDEFLREAQNDYLVHLAVGPRRSIRSQVAGWLIAIAQRIEDRPHATVARAEA
jgi:hypothetical protein